MARDTLLDLALTTAPAAPVPDLKGHDKSATAARELETHNAGCEQCASALRDAIHPIGAFCCMCDAGRCLALAGLSDVAAAQIRRYTTDARSVA
jgi:hypothetical protein